MTRSTLTSDLASALPAPEVTLLFAAGCALLQVALTALVIARRAKTEISFLDGTDSLLMRRIRAHGNFTETAPIALLLLGLLELRGLGSVVLFSFGSALLIGRLLHALGILHPRAAWARIAGMLMTLAVISVEALAGLWAILL